jgi:hypothetical protein
MQLLMLKPVVVLLLVLQQCGWHPEPTGLAS